MSTSAEQMQLDLQELRHFYCQAKRERVKTYLDTEITRLSAMLSTTSSSSQNGQRPVEDDVGPSPVAAVKVKNYAWDQSDKFLKIYVTLPRAHTVQEDQYTLETSSKSFKLIVRNLDGKNHELQIVGLLRELNPEKSYFKLKTDMVLLMLKKKEENRTWDELTALEKHAKDAKEAKKAPKFDDKEDPQVGLMKMMQNLYEEGDDDTKRTISKAWYESRQKQEKGLDKMDFDT